VANVQRLDPSLLPEGEADEETELDQLRVGKVCVQLLPESFVGDGGVPDDGAGVGEGDLLALGELVGFLKMQQTGVLCLRNAPRSRPDRPLYPSILAFNGLGDVDAAELLDGVVEYAGAEGGSPGLGEGAQDRRHMRAYSLALRPGSAMQARIFQVAEDLKVSDRRQVGILDSGHCEAPLTDAWRQI
jgi:hypothetical protein